MIEHIFIFLIGLISIDIFYIIYKLYCKLLLKRINFSEKNRKEELSEFSNIFDKKIILVYSLSTIIVGIYINFIDSSLLIGNFLEKLLSSFCYIVLPLLIYATLKIVIRRIIGFVHFLRGFKSSFIKEDDLENEFIDSDEEVEEIFKNDEIEDTINNMKDSKEDL